MEQDIPRILLIDDNPDNLRLLKQVLDSASTEYMVHAATNAQIALRFLQTTLPDIILLDVMMPEINGYQLCKELKADERTQDIPVIFVSASDQLLNKVKGFYCGGVDYIVKPFQAEEVLARVQTHLTLRSLQKSLEARVETRTKELITLSNELREQIKEKEAAQERLASQLAITQDQLLQSDKMASIGQLAAGVAHEINNPIGFVSANLGSLQQYFRDMFELLEACNHVASTNAQERDAALKAFAVLGERVDLPFLKEDIPQLIKESLEGIDRVKRIVQDLKDFSRVDAGESWQYADIHKGLDSTLNIVWNEIKYKAQVIKEYGNLPEIKCLPSQLNQVFMNMLINATQAIKTRGNITLRTGLDGAQVWIDITDTGSGIAPEHLPRIFDPFFTTKAVGQGTGLGLAVSYGIIQKHGGRIAVDSTLDKGTTFKIFLPIEPDVPNQDSDLSR